MVMVIPLSKGSVVGWAAGGMLGEGLIAIALIVRALVGDGVTTGAAGSLASRVGVGCSGHDLGRG